MQRIRSWYKKQRYVHISIVHFCRLAETMHKNKLIKWQTHRQEYFAFWCRPVQSAPPLINATGNSMLKEKKRIINFHSIFNTSIVKNHYLLYVDYVNTSNPHKEYYKSAYSNFYFIKHKICHSSLCIFSKNVPTLYSLLSLL